MQKQQYEQADILNRLGVRLLEASAGEDGWEVCAQQRRIIWTCVYIVGVCEWPGLSNTPQTPAHHTPQNNTKQPQVFSLDYQVEAPISAIIHSRALNEGYARIFHLLWRLKRVEWSLAASWKCVYFYITYMYICICVCVLYHGRANRLTPHDPHRDHMLVGHLPSSSASSHHRRPRSSSSKDTSTAAATKSSGVTDVLGGVLQACNLARREMVHFVANLSSFMMFEVRAWGSGGGWRRHVYVHLDTCVHIHTNRCSTPFPP